MGGGGRGEWTKGRWMTEEPTGSGDLTVWPVCGFQTPWNYLPLGFRILYSIVLSTSAFQNGDKLADFCERCLSKVVNVLCAI